MRHVSRRVSFPAALGLLLLLLFCAPAPADAVIYTQKKGDGIFMTNDKRKLHTPDSDSRDQEQVESADAREDARPQTEAPPDGDRLGRAAQQLEQGLKRGDVGRIEELFNFFPQQASEQSVYMHRNTVRAFFELFFNTFGAVKSLQPGATSQETMHLARVYGATSNEIKTADCTWQHENFLGTLQSGQGAVSLHVSFCAPGDAQTPLWIKDLGVAFVEPDAQFRGKAESFIERYKQEIDAVAASWRESQQEQTAAEQAQESRPAQPKPEPQPQPQAQPQPPTQTLPSLGMPGMDVPGVDVPNMDADATMMLLGMLSGTMITAVIAASILFYLLYCLCLYVIARKLDAAPAWLAWIPIAQIHPMVLAAGLPGRWTLLLLLSFLLSAIPFVGAFISLAILVIFIYLWMRISERLGVNKWLGLLVLLPILQFIYPAWLAFKNDAYRANVDLKNVLTRTVLAFLLLSALAWAGTTFFIMPMLQPVISMVSAMQAGGGMQSQGQPAPAMPQSTQSPQPTQTPPPAQPAQPASPQQTIADETAAEEAPAYVSMDAQAYETLLETAKAPAEGAAQSPQKRLGPALVRYDTFWNDENSPHFWLKVVLPEIPNIALGDTSVMTISKVLDSSGADVLDHENSFEKGRFQSLSFHEMQWQTPRLEAIRDVHLLPGATEAGLASVSGELTLKLPLEIQTLTLTRGDASPQQLHGLQVTLDNVEGNEVSLTLSGELDRHVATIAYDAQGRPLDSQFRSWNTVDNETRMTYGFEGEPERVELLVASGVLQKTYPFTLELQ